MVQQLEYGIIAPGMLKKISVGIRCSDDDTGSIKESIEIVSKHDIFKVPVTARILSDADFEAENQKQIEENGSGIQNSRVKEKLLRRVAEARESHSEGPVVLTKMP